MGVKHNAFGYSTKHTFLHLPVIYIQIYWYSVENPSWNRKQALISKGDNFNNEAWMNEWMYV